MGLPGSGKTTLAKSVVDKLRIENKQAVWFNADAVRAEFNDWDFSEAGRLRQAYRMRDLADAVNGITLCDFVAPTNEIRNTFNADFTVWVDTLKVSRYKDTNKVFCQPTEYDVHVTYQDASYWASVIVSRLEWINY